VIFFYKKSRFFSKNSERNWSKISTACARA